MFWTRILGIFFSGGLMAVHTTPAPVPEAPRPALDELLSYACARSVATMVDVDRQTGPVFSDGVLVFTSIEAGDGSKVLIVSAGGGTYAVPLAHSGTNRIRFEIPTQAYSRNKRFFLNYVHDSAYRSRFFEFSMDRAPSGHEELDYRWVQPQRADYMLANLDYAIYETSENELNALTEGRISRVEFNKRKADCDHISRRTPTLARTLRRNLDVLEMIVIGPQPKTVQASTRLPASVSPD